MIVLEVIFWVCILLLLHSYLFYPVLLRLLAGNQSYYPEQLFAAGEVPFISILLSVYNEEAVIAEKIRSTLNTAYPPDRMEMWIGSDASSDHTDELAARHAAQDERIHFLRYEQRMGKAGVMNALADSARGGILLLTDANVFFTRETIGNLARHFEDEKTGLVAGTIVNPEIKDDGVSRQESVYQAGENVIKFREGYLWGATMGAFGGCYAIRKKLFAKVPGNCIVDDFYLTMKVLEAGGRAISDPAAIGYEDAGNRMKEEFRRKSRIATGNFQIMESFLHMLSPRRGGVAFAFLSHKVLRWHGPFFILGAWICSFVLSFDLPLYRFLFWAQTAFIAVPVVETMLRKLSIHLPGLRFISHFYVMNLALLNGFFKYLNGVKDNVWEPTQRNQ